MITAIELQASGFRLYNSIMSVAYYLSPFIGTGVHSDPFRPRLSLYGHVNMLDMRPDETRIDGWCFAVLKDGDRLDADADPHLSWLAIDPNAALSSSAIELICRKLGVNVRSTTLADVIAEILLLQLVPGRGLRFPIDGVYRIYLGRLLKALTEDEAYEFVGRLRTDELLKQASEYPPRRWSNLRAPLAAAMDTIRAVADHGSEGWLERQIDNAGAKTSRHALVRNYAAAQQLLDAPGHKLIHQSPEAIWLLMLARDLASTQAYSDVNKLASRIRSVSDCEPLRFELYVLAGFVESGARVERTDTDATGEFRVSHQRGWVYVECKYKNRSSIKPRLVKPVFDRGNQLIETLMSEKDKRALIMITCRTDPRENELPQIQRLVSRALDEYPRPIREGKYEVEVVPSSWITNDGGARLPTGYDYGFSQAKKIDDSISVDGLGVVWRVNWPGGWIRSAIDSIRQAASQLPANSPNLVYLHVPNGELGVVRTRMDTLMAPVEELLMRDRVHQRVNAVILVGEAQIANPSTMTTTRYMYQPVYNQHARTPLPDGFHVLGDDLLRMPRG